MIIIGSVKIDIHAGDKKYYNISYSSKEDICKIFKIIDIIYEDAYKGNKEALVIINDIQNLIDEDDFVLREYINIQIGKKPLTVKDCNVKIIDVVAERLGLGYEKCEEEFYKSISKIQNKNMELWRKWIENNKNNMFFVNKTIKNDKKEQKISIIDENKLKELDYIKKYLVPKYIFESNSYPKNLQELIKFDKYNLKVLKDLSEKYKNDKKNSKLKDEIRKRTNYDIELSKDIVILKKHYNVKIKNTNKKGKNKNIPIQFIKDSELTSRIKELENDVLIDKLRLIENAISIAKIDSFTELKLTKKQKEIFDMYYKDGYTQQQIADRIKVTRPYITKALKNIINKIKNNVMVDYE